jgi:hypothetical protein
VAGCFYTAIAVAGPPFAVFRVIWRTFFGCGGAALGKAKSFTRPKKAGRFAHKANVFARKASVFALKASLFARKASRFEASQSRFLQKQIRN